MKLYHYTTLESLALILKNRTIKFNRLDCVDDVEEGNAESAGVNLSKYMFVSCWTENSEESIPLWKMYAGDRPGVRVALDSDMFMKYLICHEDGDPLDIQGSILSRVPKEILLNPNFFIFPPQIINTDQKYDIFFRKVEYVDDVKSCVEHSISCGNNIRGVPETCIQLGKIGKYKHRRWAFQEEVRFVLGIFPGNWFYLNGDNAHLGVLAILNNQTVDFTSFFLHLSPEVIETIEITLSPSSTESHRIMVEALCDKYAPKATVRDSGIKNLVKLK